jgi:hypothetical protein
MEYGEEGRVTWLTITNAFIVICAIVAAIFSYKLWRLLESRAALLFTIVSFYMLGYRTFILVERQMYEVNWYLTHQGYFLIPFWPLFAAAIYLMYKSICEVVDKMKD